MSELMSAGLTDEERIEVDSWQAGGQGASTAALSDARPRVLIVDDEPHVIRGIQSALYDRPYEILGATSARAALTTLHSSRIDVVVADERMPGVTGSQLLCIVAREFPRAGRIVLTGQASVEAAMRAINQAKVVRFLLKPCETRVLCAAIEAALDARGQVGRPPVSQDIAQPAVARSWRRATGGEGAAQGRFSLCGREADTAGIADVGVASVAPLAAPSSSDLLLYTQKSVQLDTPMESCGLEILSWVRTKLGRVLTLAEFASIGRGEQGGRLMEREATLGALNALRPRAHALRHSRYTVSLPLSADSMLDGDFVRLLVAALSHSQVADRVMMQIGSTIAMLDRTKLVEAAHAICSAGCQLGVGGVSATASVLATLRGMPVRRITIDRRLSDEVVTNRSARAEISAIVDHARGAGIDTAASFVATSAAARELRTLGVDYGQGYAFGAPEPLLTVLESLA
jgi:EAL domain-containing protein (putative c-di-GMP-specific phosphodiesterase class I)/DNA-binding NarL/FixJ family response regulator